MPLDICATVQQNSCILSFLRVLRSDTKEPGHCAGFFIARRGPQESRPSAGIFVPARNATAARAGPIGTAWTLLAGSVVYGKTPAARAPIPSLCWWVARDLIGETGASGCQRWNGLRRTGGERPTQSGQAEGLPPAFQAEQRRVRFPLPAPISLCAAPHVCPVPQ